ncbi:siderophore-iron reductase FhuF [Pseudomonas sp. HR96]|uniref:siderophore-iron reductase FhuF n=1 Tax=Pseudomonas sp. HR96 TaxID=1027966 RepID=UPI002A74F359|nr:siderophore-iron reductase FhuF [Pseudomonas sp. HR96]WPP01167.1 siderophore-iron reductase FhuF [Pseudomonas sp. HR96]
MDLDELLQPAHLDTLLLRMYGPALCAEHHPVLVSQWSKYYFMSLWPCLLEAGPQRSAAWEMVRVKLGARGLPEHISLAEARLAASPDELYASHLRPLVGRLAAYAKVPAAVFWSNAGDALEQALPAFPQAAWARALLSPSAGVRPRRGSLQGTVHYSAQGCRKVRACCLAWQVPGIGYCAHCPLQD